jgi:hypothetical protein
MRFVVSPNKSWQVVGLKREQGTGSRGAGEQEKQRSFRCRGAEKYLDLASS